MTAKMASAMKRVQFDLLPERIAEFDQLMSYCDLGTRKDLFDNAMTLFEWAINEVRGGKDIASYDRDRDKVEVVRLPVLDNAARRARSHKSLELVAANGTLRFKARRLNPINCRNFGNFPGTVS